MKAACWLRWKLLPVIYWLTDLLCNIPRCRRCSTCGRCQYHGAACAGYAEKEMPF